MKLLLADLPIFVAHWASLAERRARLERELFSMGLEATWLTGYDAEKLAGADLRPHYRRDDTLWRRKTEFYADVPARELKASELSLALKHMDAYQKLSESGHSHALVLEDDALLSPNFRARFDQFFCSAPDDFDFVFIGSGCNLRVPNVTPTEQFYPKATPATKCTDSYVVARTAAERLLEAGSSVTLPIDFELNYRIHAFGMKVYWLEPPIVVQGSQNGTYASAIQ